MRLLKSFTLFCAVFLIISNISGCSGTTSQSPAPIPNSSPLGAVSKIMSSITQNNRLAVTTDSHGTPTINIPQTPGYDEESIGQINFTDLSGTKWFFDIINVEYTDDFNAVVNTRYTSLDCSCPSLDIKFMMLNEAQYWYLSAITVTEIATSTHPSLFTLSGTIEISNDPEASIEGIELLLVKKDTIDLYYTATTDKQGFFSFSLPTGSYKLTFSENDKDYYFANVENYENITIESNLNLGTVSIIGPTPQEPDNTIAIYGTITSSATGEPLGGALVNAYKENTDGTLSFAGYSITNSEGFYRIVLAEPGYYTLVTERAGYKPFTKSGHYVEAQRSTASNMLISRSLPLY